MPPAYRIVWWRVALLAALTAAAGFGSWRAFTSGGRQPAPTPPPTASAPLVFLPEPAAVPATTPPPATPTPPPVRRPPPRRRGPAPTRAPTPRPTPPPDPFRDLPGAGTLRDLCPAGACR